MPDDAITAKPRPYWLPDTQGFLAIAILLLMGVIVMILLNMESAKLDDKIAGVLMTVVGVLTACLKDVYSFFFGSSKGSEKKDEVMTTLATTPSPSTQAPTPDQLAESMLTNGEKTYFKTLTDETAKKNFLAMSATERAATVAKG